MQKKKRPMKSKKINEKLNTGQMKCLSCDNTIKSKDLKKHSESKTHVVNVNKKVDVMKQHSRKGNR